MLLVSCVEFNRKCWSLAGSFLEWSESAEAMATRVPKNIYRQLVASRKQCWNRIYIYICICICIFIFTFKANVWIDMWICNTLPHSQRRECHFNHATICIAKLMHIMWNEFALDTFINVIGNPFHSSMMHKVLSPVPRILHFSYKQIAHSLGATQKQTEIQFSNSIWALLPLTTHIYKYALWNLANNF